MKPVLFLFILITTRGPGNAQQNDTVKYQSKEYYMNKSRSQSTSAWVLLGGGAALATGGLLIGMNNLDWGFESNYNDGDYDLGMGMFWVGSAAMLGSIPLFIASAKNKGRSMSASAYFKMEDYQAISRNGFTNSNYPALSLRITLK